MSEKRKPIKKIIAENSGKRYRIEFFQAELWPYGENRPNRYRIRINGKWYGGKRKIFLTITQVMKDLRKFLVK